MKIAILQFNPHLGEVDRNIQHADDLLAPCTTPIDLLVLPEMCFTGYNFPNLAAITPYLEPTAQGPSTRWAQRVARERACVVIVGYPETTTETKTKTGASETGATGTTGTGTETVTRHYNATVTVGPSGQILAHYRKSFLYYTDETWASEGFRKTATQQPFFASTIPFGGALGSVVMGHGICMDINPYRFEAAWTDYEFATQMLAHQCKLVVLSMAWLTRMTPEETRVHPERPDMETVAYWLERFWPFVDSLPAEPIVVVFANRCGSEGSVTGGTKVDHGETVALGDQVAYAGSSCVMRFQNGSVKLWEHHAGPQKGDVGLLGKGQEGTLVVDTGVAAGFLLQQKSAPT
jgi:protein N-terminal amidase